MPDNSFGFIKLCAMLALIIAMLSRTGLVEAGGGEHGHSYGHGSVSMENRGQLAREGRNLAPDYQRDEEVRGESLVYRHDERLAYQGNDMPHGHPSINRVHGHEESRGDYYYSGRHYNYRHNGVYYNYYHNNEYYLYFVDGAYYNYFYNGAYYVYFVDGRYYNYFYRGAYYQNCRKIPGYRSHGRWIPATMICH